VRLGRGVGRERQTDIVRKRSAAGHGADAGHPAQQSTRIRIRVGLSGRIQQIFAVGHLKGDSLPGGGDIPAQKQQRRDPVRERLHRVVDAVEEIGGKLPVQLLRFARKPEAVKRIPILERGERAEDDAALGPVRVGTAIIELGHGERFAVDSAGRQHRRDILRQRERAFAGNHDRQLPPHRPDEARMRPVSVLVDIIVIGTNPGDRHLRRVVVIGKRRPDAQIAQELRKIPVNIVLDPGDKPQFSQILTFAGAQLSLGRPAELLEFLFDERRRVRLMLNPKESVLVDQADENQRRIVFPRQFGVRVDVGQEVAGKRLEIVPRLLAQHDMGLAVLDAGESPVRQRRAAHGVKVERDINPAVFEALEEIIHAVELFGIGLKPLRIPRHRQVVVEMVEPDRVVPHPRQQARQFLRMFAVGEAEIEIEIGSVETDRPPRIFLKDEFPVPDGEKTVFPGGRIGQKREIERGPGQHGTGYVDRFPVGAGDLENRLRNLARRRLGGSRNRGDHPDRAAVIDQLDPVDRAAVQRPGAQIKAHIGPLVLGLPGDVGARQHRRIPPVADIFSADDGERPVGAVGVDDPDSTGPDAPLGGPAQCVEQTQIPVLPFFPGDGGLERLTGQMFAAQYNTAFSVGLLIIGDIKFHSAEVLHSGGNHMQVVVRPLVGPAAPSVPGARVGKSEIGGIAN